MRINNISEKAKKLESKRYIPNEITGTIEIGNNIIYLFIYNEYPAFILYEGTRKKPSYNKYFLHENNRSEFVNSLILKITKKEREKKFIKDARKKEIEKFRNEIEIGDVFYSSWGYEQTNLNFFQVVGKKGATITLREIEYEIVERTGLCSSNVVPVKNRFRGEEFKKRVMSKYIKLDDVRYLSKTDYTKTHHCSWGY